VSRDHVDRVIKAVRAKFGDESALRLSDGAACEVREVIPTGVAVLDHYVFGVGGMPVGRLVEVYSDEGVGKTTYAYTVAAGAQREGGIAIWAETENGIDNARARLFGCDVEQLVLLQPGSIEQAGQQIEAALGAVPASVGPNAVVWDSIAATPTQREVDDGLSGDDRIGERARALGKICKVLSPLAVEKRACLLFVNQVREKIGVMFGDKYTTPGGHAVKFHASIRLQLFGGKAVKDEGEHTGKVVTFLATKNRLAPPWRKAQVRLDYAAGWDDDWATLAHAKDRGLVPEAARMSAALLEEARAKLGWT